MGEARIAGLELVDEVLGRQVEAVAVELAAGPLEHVGERALELLAPVSTGGVHVLDLPDGAGAVLTEFGEDVAVGGIEAVLSLVDEVTGHGVARFPFAEVGVHLGHQSLGGATGGATEVVEAVGAALGQELNGEFEVLFDEVPDLVGRGPGLLVLGGGQRRGHERHTAEGGHEAEVPVGADEVRLGEVGVADLCVHVDLWNLLQREVAVGDAAVGHLPLDEEHLAGTVALETLEVVELRIVPVTGASLVGVV